MITVAACYALWRFYWRKRMEYWSLGHVNRSWDVDTTGRDQQ